MDKGVATATARLRKIERLRAVVGSGRYTVDVPKIAEKMIKAALVSALGKVNGSKD